MAHIRKQLRDKVQTMLITALSTSNVFVNRTHAIQESELPAAIIKTSRESVEISGMNSIDRDIELTIDLYEKSAETVDDDLDALCVLVENAFNADVTIGADYKELVSTEIDIDDGDQQVGIATMVYQIQVIDSVNPETVI